jgi:hypothetical protein
MITVTVTTTSDTYGVGISGNVTAHQMSNVTITPHRLRATTIVSFTVTGPSGKIGFGNMTLPIENLQNSLKLTVVILLALFRQVNLHLT